MKSADYETAKAVEAALKAALGPEWTVQPTGGPLPAANFLQHTEVETRPHKRLKAPQVTRTITLTARDTYRAMISAEAVTEALTGGLTVNGFHVQDVRLELSTTQQLSDAEGPITRYIQRYRFTLHPE